MCDFHSKWDASMCLWVNVLKVPLNFTDIEASVYTSFLYSEGIACMLKNYNAWSLFLFLLCSSSSCSAVYLAGTSQNIWLISVCAAELILSIINCFKLARSSALAIPFVFFTYCGTCSTMIHCLFTFSNMYFGKLQSAPYFLCKVEHQYQFMSKKKKIQTTQQQKKP